MTPPPTHHAIAIDGPAASGKSTLARELARRLGLVMVNSGAMYRAVTWAAISRQIDPADSAAVVDMLNSLDISCSHDGIASTIHINGVDPGDALRAEHVNHSVSIIAAIPQVRERLVALQRDYLKHTSIVMEGRDIGSVVFPDTPFKIYVTAEESVRAERRRKMGEVDSVATRDAADSNRKTAPLMVANGAKILDNSLHTIESGVNAAIDILGEQGWKFD
ncbi:MAG: (d)CMP kinase [Luteolibacter sp.]|jgi:CMP/dCMP kinase